MRKKFLMLVIVAALAVLSLVACNNASENGETGGSAGEQSQVSDGLTLDLTALNYSDTATQSFYIYDGIDLNKVVFVDEEYAGAYAYFDIGLNGELLTTVMYKDGKFPYYTFKSIGTYVIVVTAGKAGAQHSKTFAINVTAGGRPTSVEFGLENENGEKVESVYAGSTYYTVANVYSDGALITSDAVGIKTYWEADTANAGVHRKGFTFANSHEKRNECTKFTVQCVNNLGQLVLTQFPFEYVLNDSLLRTDDNPEGIYWSFGESFAESNSVALNISAKECYGGYFVRNVTAKFKYKDGAEEVIPVAYNDADEEDFTSGKAYIMIEYDGENAFKKYSVNKVGNKTSGDGLYVKGDAVYQFNPDKTGCNLYLVYFDGETQIAVSNSMQFIEFQKTAIEDFCVEKIENKYTKVTYNEKTHVVKETNLSPTFTEETLTVADNTVEVIVQRNGTNNNNDHSFIAFPTFTNAGSYGDYIVKINNPKDGVVLRRNNATQNSFFPVKVGTATITFTSVNTEDVYTLTVNVKDPVVGYYLTTATDCPNYGYSVPLLNDYVKVNRAYYSGAFDTVDYNDFTSIATDGELQATSGGNATSTLTSRASAYKIDLKIQAVNDFGKNCELSTSVDFYIVPDLTVSCSYFSISVSNNGASATWNRASNGGYIGSVPTFTFDEVPTDYTNSLVATLAGVTGNTCAVSYTEEGFCIKTSYFGGNDCILLYAIVNTSAPI